ncbi:MAG: LysE family transporter [Chloroflexi bacterium]|jgi:threonine/homoserine/homoserine lactone efflux protein|nr:LysE family transporter [Chloroflexota bacterium]MBT3670432.1 LysE family transporter [Chloroflexota bacterium]MBT4002933.1 LysE family transporter [Chloroflexota bacterium]MBT4304666.1 LysE family transporter [Chloroflexota bacterium]MBT4534235.1 LysE family transporter [Chloroflexota bacterium]
MTITALLTIFISSFIFGIAAVVSPGPVSTAIVSQAPRRGWVVGPLVATGHSILELAIIIMIALGMSAGLNTPGIQIFIALVGGIVLIWMGANMVTGVFKGEIRVPGISGTVETLNSNQLVRLGMITTLSSPFWYAWWVTSVPSYLTQINAVTPIAIGAFFFGHISADYAWNSLLSTVIAGGKRWVTDRVYQSIIGLCGIFFIYLGVGFIIEGYKLIQLQ